MKLTERPGIIPGLSLKQPWAWAVEIGAKDVENRDKRTNIRGALVIQAAKSCEPAYYREAVQWMVDRGLVRHRDFKPANRLPSWHEPPEVPDLGALPRGVLLARTEIVDVLERVPTEAPWHMADKFGYVLANTRAIARRPFVGLPGFFPVPEPEVITT